MTTRIEGIPAEFVPAYWPYVEPWIAQAIRGCLNYAATDDVLAELGSGEMQLWALWSGDRLSGAVISQIYETRRGKTCELFAAGGPGGLDQFFVAQDEIARWAASEGCVRMYSEVRPGVRRLLAEHGWRQLSEQIEKAL